MAREPAAQTMTGGGSDCDSCSGGGRGRLVAAVSLALAGDLGAPVQQAAPGEAG